MTKMLGYTGHAPGALPNGTPIRKARYEKGDAHQVGTLGMVLGSLGPLRDHVEGVSPQLAAEMIGGYIYCVKWGTDPRPQFIISVKIEVVR
jgi:hypothetical protein